MATSTQCCPECEGRLRESESETVCGECGLVVAEDNIDRGPEWRSFADDETEKERTGAPLTRSRHDRGLTTEIGRSTRLKGRKRRRFARMRRQHSRSRIKSKAERNRVYAFGEIRRLVSALDLTDHVRDQSCVLFESAQKEDLLRGRSIEGFTAAVVYATCRTASVSRTLDEVADAARASESELTAAYDALNQDLGLPTGPIDPAEYLPRFASQLDLPQAVERRADALVDTARDRGLVSGRDPSGVAAGCLYLAARQEEYDLTQAEAAETAGVTPVTLRSTYQDLRE
ncbi:transcription initiation factor IIB [Halorientalis regularis]|jgi:transcription initiation factor TFIIB|uniref:Transcription initiation factor IIB n=1 Tax=Halorientalis regularis TaxID=660518 RepID=A0A1G7GVN2_9EURY|nr:transcription initiation factor IIB family protein [Halorientalis regularis]SDE92238.1 Transcription initiation factor IIB (TFIIB) [Halorientalis regularis]